MATIESERLYTLDEAAELLHVSRRTVQRHTRSGALPARRLGRRVYIVGSDLLNLPDYEPPGGGGGCTLGELAERITGGNLVAMAKMLNDARANVKPLTDAGAALRYDEIEPDAAARVDRLAIIDLFAERAGDRVGRVLREVLNETSW